MPHISLLLSAALLLAACRPEPGSGSRDSAPEESDTADSGGDQGTTVLDLDSATDTLLQAEGITRLSAVGDVDGDGTRDGLVATVLGTPGTEGAERDTWLLTADVLLAGDTVEPGQGTRLRTPSQVLVTPGDIDGDGISELHTATTVECVAFSPSWVVDNLEGCADQPVIRPETDVTGLLYRGGDADGDGRSELLMGFTDTGRPADDPGTTHLLLGAGLSAGAAVDFSTPDVVITGARPGDLAGVHSLADVDGDGLQDLVASSNLDWIDGTGWEWAPAEAYVVSGERVLSGANLDLADADWTFTTSERTLAVQAARDIDGDGLQDLLLNSIRIPRSLHLIRGAELAPGGGVHVMEDSATTLTHADDLRLAAWPVGDLRGDGGVDLALIVQGDGEQLGTRLLTELPEQGVVDVDEQASVLVAEAILTGLAGTGDLDGDGDGDLQLLGSDDTLRILLSVP